MDGPPSGLLKAGQILLLVGAILQSVGSVVALLYGTIFAGLIRHLASRNGSTVDSRVLGILGGIIIVLALVAAAGAVLTWLAHARAKRGDPGGAFVRGLVGSLLPPVQIVSLLGAIFCRISPEGEGRAPPTPPGAGGSTGGWMPTGPPATPPPAEPPSRPPR